MANYITTDTTDPNQTNIRMTTNLMIGADSDPAQELHVTGDGLFTGNITAYYSSDISLKDNIRPIESAIFKVQQIRGVTFDWIKDKKLNENKRGKHDYGFIAQEVELVIPEIVKTDKRGVIGIDETKNTKTIDYSRLTTFLVDAIQEQQKTISKLETRIEKLEK